MFCIEIPFVFPTITIEIAKYEVVDVHVQILLLKFCYKMPVIHAFFDIIK